MAAIGYIGQCKIDKRGTLPDFERPTVVSALEKGACTTLAGLDLASISLWRCGYVPCQQATGIDAIPGQLI